MAYDSHAVIQMLIKRKGSRTQSELAAEIGIKPQYLSDVLNRRRDPGPAILNFLNLETAFVKRSQPVGSESK